MSVYHHYTTKELQEAVDSNEHVFALIFERIQEAIQLNDMQRAVGLLKDAQTTLSARAEIMYELGRRSNSPIIK